MEHDVKEAFMRMYKRVEGLENRSIQEHTLPLPEYSEECDKLLPAIIKAKKEFDEVKKNSTGNHHKYSSLEDMYEATLPALLNNDLNLSQDLVTDAYGNSFIVTELRHVSNQYKKSYYSVLKTDKNHASRDADQQRGCSNTYAKRYAYASFLGLKCSEPDSDQPKLNHTPNPQNGSCTHCNAPLVEIYHDGSTFMGCSQYATCPGNKKRK
jgi:ERF superfamily